MANAKKRTTKRYGSYRAEVTDNVDPEAIGRVRVRLSAGIIASRTMREVWAPVATLFASSQSGSWFMPNVGDQVLVSFEAGDVRRPYVLGALWGQNARPPETMDETGQNLRRVLRSPNGVQIIFDDQPDRNSCCLRLPAAPP
jgi:uncharacterized protein involved in type VI secretion and phage assembly